MHLHIRHIKRNPLYPSGLYPGTWYLIARLLGQKTFVVKVPSLKFKIEYSLFTN